MSTKASGRNPDLPMWLDKLFHRTDIIESNTEENSRYFDSPYFARVFGWRDWFSIEDSEEE